MGKRHNYPSHQAPRVYQVVYRDKNGTSVLNSRASSILTAVRNIPQNCTAHKAAAEVEVFHIHDRTKHPEALVFVQRTTRRISFDTAILRPHLP